jgi:hypothetical protein
MNVLAHCVDDHLRGGVTTNAYEDGWNAGVERVWDAEVEPLRQQLQGAVVALEEIAGLLDGWDQSSEAAAKAMSKIAGEALKGLPPLGGGR